MRHLFRVAFAGAFSLGLSACYSSHTALITSANADYPFGASTEFRFDAQDGPQGVLRRVNDHYEKQYSDTEALHTQFDHIEGDFYVVQELNETSHAYTYDLARIEDEEVYIYGIRCERDEDRDAIASGLLESVDGDGMLTCWINDYDTFKQALLARGASVDPSIVSTYYILP